MVRLGRPHNVSEADFKTTVQDIRDALLRQRALFPQTPAPEADVKGLKRKKSGATLTPSKSMVATSTKEGDDEEGGSGGTVAVNNPRVAVVTYDDVLTKAAMELAAKSGDVPAASVSLLASSSSAIPPSSPQSHGLHHNDPPVAHWSYSDVYLGAVQKIIKKTEALRKKQQLYIGYGRSVTFDKIEEIEGGEEGIVGEHVAGFGGHAPPSYRVDVAKKSNSVAALSGSPSLATSQALKEGSDRATSTGSDALPALNGAIEAEGPVGTSPIQEGASPSQGNTTIIAGVGDELLLDADDASSAQMRQTPLLLEAQQSSSTSASPAAAAPAVGDREHTMIPMKSCGDPKSMKLLDKCEWTPEELTDAFDLVADGAQPTQLLSTDPLGWIEKARFEARSGRFRAAPTPVQEVTSFKTTVTKTAAASASNLNFQRLASQKSAAPTPAAIITTSSATFGPGPSSPLAATVLPSAVSVDTTTGITADANNIQGSLKNITGGVISPVDAALATSQTSGGSGAAGSGLSRVGSGSSVAPSSKPPVGKRQGSSPAPAAATAAAKGTPKTERKKVAVVSSSEITPISDEGLATAANPSLALASLFAPVDDDKLPHNLPPLTVVFEAFTVVSTLLPAHEDEGDTRVDSRFVCFQQLRPFYLRPPLTNDDDEDANSDESDDDEFWDDAVEELQQDMNDELLVPMTPPSTPVSWVPPEPETPFVPAPFTQLLIDRLEAGIPTPKNSSDDESEHEEEEATEGVNTETKAPKRRASEDGEPQPVTHNDDAIKKMQEQNDEVLRKMEDARQEKLQNLRAMRGDHRPALSESGDGSGLQGTAWERTLERFLCISKKNNATRGVPLLLSTRLPMRMEGTTSVVRRLMRRSKKDILALSKKSKQAQLVSFRPSRRFLAEVLRLRSFGPLVVALLSNPDDPIPDEAVSVSLDELGERLHHIWDHTPVDRQRRLLLLAQHTHHDACQLWWSQLTDALRGLHQSAMRTERSRNLHKMTPQGVPWDEVVGVLGAHQQQQPTGHDLSHKRTASRTLSRRLVETHTSRSMDSTVDENVLRKGTPHFLPQLTPSSSHGTASGGGASGAIRLAQLRRTPRAAEERSSLDASYMDRPLQAQRFLRSAGGQISGKKMFAAFRSSTPTSSVKKPQGADAPQEPPTSTGHQHHHHVYASHLYPLPVEVVGCVDSTSSKQQPLQHAPRTNNLSTRQEQAINLQQSGMRQLNELRFAELHEASKLK
ncbi:Hypothetical protein, putative [Bodo saltans]|uniref:Uncharacterized protein n=1 Tax=Bodo saltans TaxID=75058 RepID=A0A0S4J8N7_BODSA|nr:Hypothetical protein, putative [Bodo saltans]|eukprot:CUG86476.1 Hypothetical protein, putative [Bodo saltans]